MVVISWFINQHSHHWGGPNHKPAIFSWYPLVNIEKAMENGGFMGKSWEDMGIPSGKHTKNDGKIHHAINGTINDFHWAIYFP